MVTKEMLADWLNEYIAAWKSYDPEAIGDLFTEDVVYYAEPYSEPYRGRAAVVRAWLDNKDAPDTFAAEYEPVAVDGDMGVGTGRSRYFKEDGRTFKAEYSNLFLVRLDSSGRCREYREWYMKKPDRQS